MDNVSKTMYIPLYGKSWVSRRGLILKDPKAEEIWAAEGFPLRGKAKSKWLAYYMGMRSAVFDSWLGERLAEAGDAAILHLGCGMDSRVERVGWKGNAWYDVDLPPVIRERKRYYRESETYHMLEGDLCSTDWLEAIPAGKRAVVLMEGVSMYLEPEALNRTLAAITRHFGSVVLLMDCYTTLGARATKYKNPINTVGVTRVWGMDDPRKPEQNTGLAFVREHEMTPEALIRTLPGLEQPVFRKLFAGSVSRKLYRLYEYRYFF